jgi:sulfhydrogenase subunit delta
MMDVNLNHPKPKVAFFDFTGCEGCQLTVLDALQTHPDLLEAVEIVNFREAMSERSDDYSIAFIEGSISRVADEARIHAIREQADTLIALGSCAHLGGVNAIRAGTEPSLACRLVYGDQTSLPETGRPRPVHEVVPTDAFLPGCPIDREEFIRALTRLLQGRAPSVPDYPVCVECKLRENTCGFSTWGGCLGPVVRGGCGAICPTFNMPCEGCRGLISNPKLSALRVVFEEHGVDQETFDDRMRTFLTLCLPSIDTHFSGEHGAQQAAPPAADNQAKLDRTSMASLRSA